MRNESGKKRKFDEIHLDTIKENLNTQISAPRPFTLGQDMAGLLDANDITTQPRPSVGHLDSLLPCNSNDAAQEYRDARVPNPQWGAAETHIDSLGSRPVGLESNRVINYKNPPSLGRDFDWLYPQEEARETGLGIVRNQESEMESTITNNVGGRILQAGGIEQAPLPPQAANSYGPIQHFEFAPILDARGYPPRYVS